METLDKVSIVAGVICYLILCVGLRYAGMQLLAHSHQFKRLGYVLSMLSYMCAVFVLTSYLSPTYPHLGTYIQLMIRPFLFLSAGSLLWWTWNYRQGRR